MIANPEYNVPQANPYIQPVQPKAQIQPTGNPNPSGINLNGAGTPPGMAAPTSPGGGWWNAPDMSINPVSSQKFAQKNYSPQYLGGLQDVYGGFKENLGMVPDTAGQWRDAQPKSLAELYRSGVGDLGSMEQEAYNQALSRLKGAYGGAQGGLMNSMAARRGGAGSGAFMAGQADLGRQYMGGAQDIVTNQAMQNIANQERRLTEGMGYESTDIGNQMGWLQGMTGAMGQDWGARQEALGGYGGWMNSQLPYEQFNITTPWAQAAEQRAGQLAGQTAEERINAQRRAEGMGNLNALMGWQGQLGGQYGQGQNAWLNYQNQAGQANLGGYQPNWYNY